MKTKKEVTGHPAPPASKERTQNVCIDAEELFRGRREIVISHGRERYVLRITRHGKLILNK